MKVTIRPMNEGDIEKIVRYHSPPWMAKEKWLITWQEYHQEHIKNIRTVAIVENHGEIIGWGNLLRRSDYPNFHKIPEINALWIIDDYRRKENRKTPNHLAGRIGSK